MTPRNHKHAEMIRRWLDDDRLVVEVQHPYSKAWTVDANPLWIKGHEYRFQLITIRIGEFDVPEPLRVEPASGSEVFLATLFGEEHVLWSDNPVKKEWLRRGLIHATQEDAELHARALISLTEVK